MKKEYVKPTIEGEAFVANEYVAACWTVSCMECGAYEEGYDLMKNSYLSNASDISNGVYRYDYDIDGVDPCFPSTSSKPPAWVNQYWWGGIAWAILKAWFGAQDQTETTYHHMISATNNWTYTTNHPNASV